MKKYVKGSTEEERFIDDIVWKWAQDTGVDEKVIYDGMDEPDEPEVLQAWLDKNGYKLTDEQYGEFEDRCWSYIEGIWDHCVL
jgi:hypothetical protein